MRRSESRVSSILTNNGKKFHVAMKCKESSPYKGGMGEQRLSHTGHRVVVVRISNFAI